MSEAALMPETPWSDEAEQNALALVLMHPAAAVKLAAELKASDFYRPNHRRIFTAAQELLAEGRPVDPVILSDHLRAEPWFQELDGSAYLHTLAGLSALVAHADEYGRIVHEYARKRETVLVGDALSAGRMTAAEASRGLPFVTGLQLAQEKDAELQPVVAGLLYRGTSAELSGRIKNGKTTFALEMASSVIVGEPFLEKTTTRSPVIYLTEQNRPSFRAGLERAQLLGCPDLHLLFRHEYRAPWPAIAAGVGRHALQVGAGLVIVDTLHEWANLGREDENDAGAALEAMRPVHEIAAAGPAVCVLRHERKGGGEIGENARGSSAFGGSADVLMVLRLPKGSGHDNRRELEVAGRLHEKSTITIEYNEGRYELLGDRTDIERQDCRAVILEALPMEASRALTQEDLMDRVGERASRSTLMRVLGELVDQGQVTKARGASTGHPRAFAYWIAEASR